ncbi:hypothetical protein GRI69_15385 [Erythrobacter vulgaris]|uniref:Uncharacterized protein n=1 Tax=Qipengyuania vulgaris TaxID=291985 RepID=A0A844XWZ8_9SPHN|nr:hypothetical protein [Qipengyuania vulgaris]MXO49633.1 hypothetical protein [Qipengyuania vulgaris]
MDNAPLYTLMIEMLRRATAAFPDLRAQLDAYLEMKAKTEERDTGEKLTAAARKAREVLRNNLLLQMPLKRALRQYEKAVRKRRAKAQKAAAEALLSFVEWEQYQIELDILSEDNPAIDADVPPSRERTDQDRIDAMVRPFIEGLIKRGNAASTIGRLTDLPTDLIARIIADLRDDPDFQNPANIWLHMFRAGIVDAFAGSMTPEEAAAIDYARHTLEEDAGAVEFARAAREDCGLPAGFSTTFLKGLYHLRTCLAEVSEGQARAYARAFRLVHDRDVELLGKVLKLTEQDDLDRLQTLVHFLTQRKAYEARDTALTIQLVAVQNEFERLEAHNRSTDDWARDVPKMIETLAHDFADTVPGSEAFEMLLASGFRLSSTCEEVARLADRRREEERRDLFLDEIRFACSVDQRFKVVGETVHLEWDEGFEDVDARFWDRASWEAEHGPVFSNYDSEDDQDHEPVSGGPEAGKGGETGTDLPTGHENDVPLLADEKDGPATDHDDTEISSPVSANLPVIAASQVAFSPSLFDFEEREKADDAPPDGARQSRAEQPSAAQKLRPMTRKTIDKLTDEDFR